MRPSGVCKKVYQLNLRRRRENTRKYANPLVEREWACEPDGGKKMLIVLCLSVRREAVTYSGCHPHWGIIFSVEDAACDFTNFMKKKKTLQKKSFSLQGPRECPSK